MSKKIVLTSGDWAFSNFSANMIKYSKGSLLVTHQEFKDIPIVSFDMLKTETDYEFYRLRTGNEYMCITKHIGLDGIEEDLFFCSNPRGFTPNDIGVSQNFIAVGYNSSDSSLIKIWNRNSLSLYNEFYITSISSSLIAFLNDTFLIRYLRRQEDYALILCCYDVEGNLIWRADSQNPSYDELTFASCANLCVKNRNTAFFLGRHFDDESQRLVYNFYKINLMNGIIEEEREVNFTLNDVSSEVRLISSNYHLVRVLSLSSYPFWQWRLFDFENAVKNFNFWPPTFVRVAEDSDEYLYYLDFDNQQIVKEKIF